MFTELSFEHYKAFRGRHTLEIRPLTVLIGRNSSGKSVITRLPLLIARSLSRYVEGGIALKFDQVDFGNSFLDLIYGRSTNGSISLGATITEGLQFTTKIQYFDEYKLPVVVYCALTSTKNKDRPTEKIEFKITENFDPREKKIYQVTCGEVSQEVLFDFNGILPLFKSSRSDDLRSFIQTCGDNFALPIFDSLPHLFDAITYLGPFRDKPERIYIAPEGNTTSIGMGGVKTPFLLADDLLRTKGKLLEKVGMWFKDYLGGWRLNIQSLSLRNEVFSIVLEKGDISVNIADVGTGIAQVLPIVVQRQLALMAGGTQDTLEIVEQPELHLHPAAHGDIADLYMAGLNGHRRFLIETHSENFLLRIRRRIAEGQFNHQDVIIYWINDDPSEGERIQAIHIDERGEVDKWPRGVFSEDFYEVRAIRRAQQILDEKKS